MDGFALLWPVSMYARDDGGLRAGSRVTSRVAQDAADAADAATNRENVRRGGLLSVSCSQAADFWHLDARRSGCQRC